MRTLLLSLMLSALPVFSAANTKDLLHKDDLRALRKSDSLDMTTGSVKTDAQQRYLTYYGLPDSTFHSFGYICSQGDSIAVHYFKPQKTTATILAVHGYLDHSAILSPLVHWALEHNFAIILPDLPGHGLSSGPRGSAVDFRHYSAMVESVINYTQNDVIGALHVIGHSTGCTPFIELLSDHKKPWSGETVLVAPLIRSAFWHISKIGYALASPFAEKTIRIYRNSSHSNEFKRFLKEEPLRIEEVSFTWSRAFYNWNNELKKATFPDYPVTVIQGTADGTVDWKYNTQFLQKSFPSLALHIIKGGRHHLFNETGQYQSRLFTIIGERLSFPK